MESIVDRRDGGCRLRWSIATVHIHSPATMFAASQACCRAVPFRSESESQSTLYDQVQSPDGMLATIKNDMEPLHLHIMTMQKWSKVTQKY